MTFDLVSTWGGFPMPPPKRHFFVPEVVQTSTMDCGPATLKSLLEGFGISVSYGRLREACQTDVDGTSIDVIEEVAMQLGLEAEQIMIPADHLLLPEAQALPAIVVVRQPNGLTHFVVVWSRHGPFVQLMDPATGRRWSTHRRFLAELYIHTLPVSAQDWREWAGSEGFCKPLRQRMLELGLDEPDITRLVDAALADPGWHSPAALDATTRMVESIVRARGLEPGTEAKGVLERFFSKLTQPPPTHSGPHSDEVPPYREVSRYGERDQTESPGEGEIIPSPYWSVRPLPPDTDNQTEEEQLLLRGAVLVRALGRRPPAPAPSTEPLPEGIEAEAVAPLSPELMAALEETPSRPELEILRFLRADGLLTPAVLGLALVLASGSIIIEALLLRGILDVGLSLELVSQRIGAIVALFAFVITLFLLELPIAATVLRFGRRLETRLRIAFLEKIPRLGAHYFHSRLTSDMTQRAHDLRQLRTLPNLGVTFLRLSFQIILTAASIIWLEPNSAPLAILATIVAIGLSFATQPILAERDMRLRTHIGALSRFYLDALLGLTPLRTHRAERAVRREHESLLVEWFRASMEFEQLDTLTQGIVAVIGSGFAIWILFNYIAQGGEASGVLLLFYWTLNLPIMGQALADVSQQYPLQRNRVLRLLEPLGAPDEIDSQVEEPKSTTAKEPKSNSSGLSIDMEQVTVQAGGQTILTGINLNLKAGEHIAIVGPSGAGKSSLVGLLLGWHRPAAGQVLVDGDRLGGQRLQQLRQEIAWVDPEVQIWNRSLLQNLRYGVQNPASFNMNPTIEQADLFSVLERLPDGLQTPLGEGGGLISGGEGQRVRLGRAMFRPRVRLAILDEPFRGLDREQRRTLLGRARQHWSEITLICVTHDLNETQTFERVLVIEEGRIVEDDAPDVLAAQPDSHYLALLEGEKMVQKKLWSSAAWRRLWLEDGRLKEN